MNDLKDLLDARLFLLDMDGTLYLGDDVFPGAVDFRTAVHLPDQQLLARGHGLHHAPAASGLPVRG